MADGLDTSVVVRLLVGLPEAQAASARALLESAHALGQPVWVSDLVIAESYFALRHHYGVPERQARTLLTRFVGSGSVRTDPEGLAATLGAASPPGLVDSLIAARYQSQGVRTVTFDRRLARLRGGRLLKG